MKSKSEKLPRVDPSLQWMENQQSNIEPKLPIETNDSLGHKTRLMGIIEHIPEEISHAFPMADIPENAEKAQVIDFGYQSFCHELINKIKNADLPYSVKNALRNIDFDNFISENLQKRLNELCIPNLVDELTCAMQSFYNLPQEASEAAQNFAKKMESKLKEVKKWRLLRTLVIKKIREHMEKNYESFIAEHDNLRKSPEEVLKYCLLDNLHYTESNRTDLIQNLECLGQEYPDINEEEHQKQFTAVCANNSFKAWIDRKPENLAKAKEYYGLDSSKDDFLKVIEIIKNYDELAEQIEPTVLKMKEYLDQGRDIVILSNHLTLANVPILISLLNQHFQDPKYLDQIITILGNLILTRKYERDHISSVSNVAKTEPKSKNADFIKKFHDEKEISTEERDTFKKLRGLCVRMFTMNLFSQKPGKITILCPGGTRDKVERDDDNRITKVQMKQPTEGTANLFKAVVSINKPVVFQIGVMCADIFSKRLPEAKKGGLYIGKTIDTQKKWKTDLNSIYQDIGKGIEEVMMEMFGQKVPVKLYNDQEN